MACIWLIILKVSINLKVLCLSTVFNNITQLLVGTEECTMLTIGVQTLENESRLHFL
jgi:hypothetical protein